MKQEIKVSGKNLNDLFALPCVKAILKCEDELDGNVLIVAEDSKNGFLYAIEGDKFVEDDDGHWKVTDPLIDEFIEKLIAAKGGEK